MTPQNTQVHGKCPECGYTDGHALTCAVWQAANPPGQELHPVGTRAMITMLRDDIEEVIALLDDHEHTDDDTARRAGKHLLEIALLGQGNAQSGATTPTESE